MAESGDKLMTTEIKWADGNAIIADSTLRWADGDIYDYWYVAAGGLSIPVAMNHYRRLRS